MERGLMEWKKLLKVLNMSELVLPVVDSRCCFALGEPPVVPESELGAEPVTVGS